MLLFGGSANGFYYDVGFKHVKYNLKQWQDVVDRFYFKYEGIKNWHTALLREASSTGKIVMPTGRFYPFRPYMDKRQILRWPETQIKNYPVQGLGADLMVLYRIIFRKMLLQYPECLIVSSVHDSVVVDCPNDMVVVVADCMFKAAALVAPKFQQCFNVPYDLPFLVEVSFGNNMKELVDIPSV